MPGIANTASTATAPPVRPTATSPNSGTTAGTARRIAAAPIRSGVQPAERQRLTQRSANTAGNVSSTSRPRKPPAGKPNASAGRIRCCPPSHPYGGSHRSQTAKPSISNVARRNSGTAARVLAATPVGPVRSVPRAPRINVGRQRAMATTTAINRAAAIKVRETPVADRIDGRTSSPLVQDWPKSPRRTPPNQRPKSCSGLWSSPSSARIAPIASADGSCSADRPRSTDSAGSRPDSQGSRPMTMTTSAVATMRVVSATAAPFTAGASPP